MQQNVNADLHFMRLAGKAAQHATAQQEIPVGAVVVKHNQVLAIAHNLSISKHDPCGHAEILALRQAARRLNNYRLVDCCVYVTLEPCAMCAAALVQARVAKVFYAASDSKTGALGGAFDLLDLPGMNHRYNVVKLPLQQHYGGMLSAFFRERREQKKALR